MVYAATLPHVDANTRIDEGQQFIIEGLGFNSWPNEIILSYSEENAISRELPAPPLMRMISKSNTQLVFEQTASNTFGQVHDWIFFSSPNQPIRTLLQYSAI